MIINLNMHFTNRCNYNCKHCMFSCRNNVQEDRSKTFNLAPVVKQFLRGYSYRLNLYGGESFLDTSLLKEYVVNLIDEDCICYGIPTNGYFLDDNKLLTEINALFINKTNTKERSKIVVSTSEYHQKQWNQEIRDIILNMDKLKQYKNLYDLLEIQNTFTTQRILPYGRAKEASLRYINPQVRCDLFKNSKDLEISINPNGDISFCDFGYIIGNINNLTIPIIRNIKNKSFTQNESKVFKNMNKVCGKCKEGKYHMCWNGGLLRPEPTEEVIQELADHKGIEFNVAEKYFNHECKVCSKKVNKNNEIAMNLKLLGRNINTYYCKKHLMEFLGFDKTQWNTYIKNFKQAGCDLF